MAEKNFAITPSVSINRSKFLRTSNHKTSFNLGDIVPIYLDEVLPGDTRSIDIASLVRMSTPIAPIMDDIELEIFAFFVPNRIVWDDWKEFMGESPTAGYHAWNGEYPYISYFGDDPNNLGARFGLGSFDPAGDYSLNVSALPLRGYLSIYNRWFRDQNVEGPCFIDTSDGQDVSTDSSGSGFDYASQPLKAYKKSDYFTRALPYAQKGAPVSLPLGTTAPIILNPKTGLYPTILRDQDGSDITGPFTDSLEAYRSSFMDHTLMFLEQGDSAVRMDPNGGLLADLSQATAATINQLREAFQLQKLLEKDALYGTRYWELLYGHFGVRSPDATLQDPEYLGGTKMMINVDQVLQTTGSDVSTPANNKLGTPGANSVTGNKGSLFTKSFVEHGFIHIYAVARQRQHTYGQGINRMWRRFDRYDYYWPEFANLGAQEIKTWELMPNFDGDGELVDDTFGYQEAWADYRYKPSIVSGLLNPAVSGSLNFWTLADKFTSTPTLGQTFLKETRANLERALVTGNTGPDFIADFYFRDVAVRPMPLYSIPGLIDHH